MLENIDKLFQLVGITMNSLFNQKNNETEELLKLKKNLFLINLIGSKHDCTTNDIINILHLPPSTATGRLEKLDSDGYITREILPLDRRYIKLQLTEKGNKIHHFLKKKMQLHIQDLLKSLSIEDQHVFVTILEKILSNIKFSE